MCVASLNDISLLDSDRIVVSRNGRNFVLTTDTKPTSASGATAANIGAIRQARHSVMRSATPVQQPHQHQHQHQQPMKRLNTDCGKWPAANIGRTLE